MTDINDTSAAKKVLSSNLFNFTLVVALGFGGFSKFYIAKYSYITNMYKLLGLKSTTKSLKRLSLWEKNKKPMSVNDWIE